MAISRVLYSGELDAPTWEDPPQVIPDFYLSHPMDGAFAVAMRSVLVAYLSLLVFMSTLSRLVDASAFGNGWLGRAMLALVIVDIATITAFVASLGAGRQLASTGVTNPETFASIHGLAWGIYWADVIVHPIWLALLGAAIVATRLFPRWLGIVVLAAALVEFTTFFLPAGAWDISGVSYLLILVLGVLVLRSPDRFTEARASR